MKEFTFTIVKPASGYRATLTIDEISQASAIREAKQRARKLGYILIF